MDLESRHFKLLKIPNSSINHNLRVYREILWIWNS